MKSGTYYGIDFGTTNTSVYRYNYMEGYGVKESKYGTDGKDIYPFSSCIAIHKEEDKKFIFGREVRDNLNSLSDEYKIITSFKSLLGTDNEITVNNIRYNGRRLAALFLNYVRKTVINENQSDDFKEAIFSIPVDFTAEARQDLLLAAESVGINVKGFVSESSAAYISKMRDIRAFSRVLVIDWGGGTLDLSLLGLKENRVYEEAVYGIKYGGDDVDKALAQRLMPYIYPGISYEELDSAKKDRLMRNIEQMKISFSTDEEDYEMICGPGSKPVTVEYDTFAEILKPIVTENAIGSIGKIMKMANVNVESIDAVILAGGSSGLRPFAEIIMMLFGENKIIFDESYQWMVARGASITAAIECEFYLNDDICVLLSDDTVYPIMKKGINKAGDKSENFSFSITDDSIDAHFIFTDSSGKNKYDILSVDAKGYVGEKMILSAEIDKAQIVKIKVTNDSISNTYSKQIEFNKLRFYYDMSNAEE